MSFLWRQSPFTSLQNVERYVRKCTRSTGKGKNTHRSNKAKEGTTIDFIYSFIFLFHVSCLITVISSYLSLFFFSKGLYHGKDVRFGHSVSHSKVHTKRRWYPNVINKRVWSDALDDWVRFKMTTTALKAIDNVGGIDNYLLSLDEASVKDSNYITKIRGLVATALFHKGLLSEKNERRLKYHKFPPPVASKIAVV